jgi:hypothetical protein
VSLGKKPDESREALAHAPERLADSPWKLQGSRALCRCLCRRLKQRARGKGRNSEGKGACGSPEMVLIQYGLVEELRSSRIRPRDEGILRAASGYTTWARWKKG